METPLVSTLQMFLNMQLWVQDSCCIFKSYGMYASLYEWKWSVWRSPASPSVLANVEHISHFCSAVLCQSINHTHLLPSSTVLREICVRVLLDLILSQYIISSAWRKSLDSQSTVAWSALVLFSKPSSINKPERVEAPPLTSVSLPLSSLICGRSHHFDFSFNNNIIRSDKRWWRSLEILLMCQADVSSSELVVARLIFSHFVLYLLSNPPFFVPYLSAKKFNFTSIRSTKNSIQT